MCQYCQPILQHACCVDATCTSKPIQVHVVSHYNSLIAGLPLRMCLLSFALSIIRYMAWRRVYLFCTCTCTCSCYVLVHVNHIDMRLYTLRDVYNNYNYAAHMVRVRYAVLCHVEATTHACHLEVAVFNGAIGYYRTRPGGYFLFCTCI